MATKKAATKKPEPTKNVPSVRAQGEPLIVIQDQMPDYIKQESARGSENVGTEDLVIPRLEVVQALSPCLDKSSGDYVPGAEIGMLMNSVTNQLYGAEVFVVPVHYSKQWLVWRERKQGGGFRGAYPNAEEARDRVEQEGGKAAGYEAIDTPTHLCLLLNRETGQAEEIIISMPRTKAKISRQWNSMVKLAGGDRFARVYRITTAKEKNPKGEFYNYVVAQSGFPGKPVYAAAEKLYEAIKAGSRNVVMDTKGFEPGEEGGDTDM